MSEPAPELEPEPKLFESLSRSWNKKFRLHNTANSHKNRSDPDPCRRGMPQIRIRQNDADPDPLYWCHGSGQCSDRTCNILVRPRNTAVMYSRYLSTVSGFQRVCAIIQKILSRPYIDVKTVNFTSCFAFPCFEWTLVLNKPYLSCLMFP
jgi:hypothetical protein